MAHGDTGKNAASYARHWLCGGLIALAGAGLAGCSPATPAPLPPPVFYSSQPVPNPSKRVPPASPATPVSATSVGAPGEVAPAAAPQTQLPADAQSPATLPPPAGLPHDATEYIEPPAR
jgi:hypothetical protein